jgi:uncharacterized SAM-binding protein YcdF (DUF218 family)
VDVSNGGLTPFTLSVVHGIMLTLLLVGLIRFRAMLLWANIMIALVAAFALFLLIDGLVSGPYRADVGLICGGATVLVSLRIYQRWHHPRTPTR